MAKKKQTPDKIRGRIAVSINHQESVYFLDETSVEEVQADVCKRLAEVAIRVQEQCSEAQSLLERLQKPGGTQLTLDEVQA